MKNNKFKYKNIEKENLVPDSVLDGARNEMQKISQVKSVKKHKTPKWALVWVSVVCVLVVAISMPIFILDNKEANLGNGVYEYDNLVKNEIQSIVEYNKLNGTDYKYLSLLPSSYYEFKSKEKTVMLSQDIKEETKSINLWVMNENISVDIFEEYLNLEKKEPLKSTFFLYEMSNNEVKVNLFYSGRHYYLLFDGYNFEEIKVLMENLIK